ncbi:endonuclease domain-containing 1 protein-like [Branchiostoma lanceolatum]|uniref:endonuclease domain-containing 1 protein-like n=1 Tax=Branchiostoma lanceolatum TaxID=7740 RepID=UPI003456C418
MYEHKGKLFALGFLGAAAVLVYVWVPRIHPIEEGGEADVYSAEDDLAESRSKAKCSLHDKPDIGQVPITGTCSKRCSKMKHDCGKFFVGEPWPPSSYGNSGSRSDSCQICQIQGNEYRFATLYNTKYRIPEYTAAVIQREKGAKQSERPKDDYVLWKRVQLGLCSENFREKHPKCKPLCDVSMPWGFYNTLLRQCGACQALSGDLDGCSEKIGVERGHLDPSQINNQDEATMNATFSMINMAPQANLFNGGPWNLLEGEIMLLAQEVFKNKNKYLYIITGTKMSENKHDKWVKGRVLFPKYFWKAVCYTGKDGAGTGAFGMGVYGLNDNNTKKKDLESNMSSLPAFNKWLYGANTKKHIFQGSVCAEDGIQVWKPKLREANELDDEL